MTTTGADRATAAPRTDATVTVHLRYFAGAAEAAGTTGEQLTLPAGATALDLRSAVVAAHGPRVERMLSISSLLVDDVVREDLTAPLRSPGSTADVRVDVLPPFAGG